MIITKKLHVTSRDKWRAWLEKNWDKEKEIWLVHYRKESGRSRIPYPETVDEALCFGWIDSTLKPIDEHKYAQRFTPRRKTSNLSQMNLERVRRLIKDGRMTDAGLKALSHVFDKDNDDHSDFKIPKDIIAALKKDKETWKNFNAFPAEYQRIRISYIEGYRERNKEEFNKRLNYFLKMTAKNKKFGMLK
ncbi:MAG: YdeI/OmpD-associated family protein [Candidatus Nanoarchaeia archaeon]